MRAVVPEICEESGGYSNSGADTEICRWVGQLFNVGHIDALAQRPGPQTTGGGGFGEPAPETF